MAERPTFDFKEKFTQEQKAEAFEAMLGLAPNEQIDVLFVAARGVVLEADNTVFRIVQQRDQVGRPYRFLQQEQRPPAALKETQGTVLATWATVDGRQPKIRLVRDAEQTIMAATILAPQNDDATTAIAIGAEHFRLKSAVFNEQEPDINNFQGGQKFRVLAAAEMYQTLSRRHPNLRIATLSSDNTYIDQSGREISAAEVMADELIHFGVPKHAIDQLPNSNSTVTEFFEQVRYMRERSLTRAGVLFDYYQLPRAEGLFTNLRRFAENAQVADETLNAIDYVNTANARFAFISAQDILAYRHPQYNHLFYAAINKPLMERTIDSERGGIGQIANGTYGGLQPRK